MNQTQQKLGYDTFQAINTTSFQAGQIFKAQSKKNQQLHKVISTEVITNLRPNNQDIQTVKIILDSPLKAKPKHSKTILLFSLKPNSQEIIVTKAGKEYLEKSGLWLNFQLLIAKQRK